MSRGIFIFDLAGHNLPAPRSIDDFGAILEALRDKQRGVNPKFVALGQKLVERYPSPEMDDPRASESPWLSSPVDEAKRVTTPLWHMDLPPDDTVRVLRYVIDSATSLGLIAYDDQLGFGVLPGGTVAPPERQELWDALVEELDNEPTPITKKEMLGRMCEVLGPVLEPHGFRALPIGPQKHVGNPSAEFERPSEDGCQVLSVFVGGEDPSLRCGITALVYHAAVERVVAAGLHARGEHRNPAFWVTPGFFHPSYPTWGLPMESEAHVELLLSLLEPKMLALLDLARDLRGLDQLMNAESSESIRTATKHAYGVFSRPKGCDGSMSIRNHARENGFVPLIVARLNGNPRFEEVVAFYDAYYDEKRVNPSRATFLELLGYLREHVTPIAQWADEGAHRASQRSVPAVLTVPPVDDPTAPRLHHQEAAYRLNELAQKHPDEFAARFATPGARARLTEYWQELARTLPPDLRVSPDGLDLSVEWLRVPGLPNGVDLIVIKFPPPERPNEWHFLGFDPQGVFVMSNRGPGETGSSGRFQHWDRASGATYMGSTSRMPIKEEFCGMLAEQIAKVRVKGEAP